ncbi:MAG: D-amino acid aminotransferase [Rhodospirillaceae bacterium]|mgnify:FL=1|nr:D-amino acid aminotransferase [Rhodospirillaceae bacterium]
MSRFVYVNGRFLRRNDAHIDIEDRGFQFGDSVYEVIFVTKGCLVDEQGHIDRLAYSMGELGMELPKSPATISLLIRELIRLNGLTDGLVYMQVSRGIAPRDHLIPRNLSQTFVMNTRQVDLTAKPSINEGVDVITVRDIRWGRCDIKTTQLLANCLVKSEAIHAGADEAWMVDENNFVTEGSSSNAWIITDDQVLVTRPPTHDILNGITRQTIIDIAMQNNVVFEERAFSPEEAKNAAEAFFTSATSLATPVLSIDGVKIGGGVIGPITKILQDQYLRYAQQTSL